MKRSIRRVADLLGAFALKQGWSLSDIQVYYRADDQWGKIDFLLITNAFGNRDEYECYNTVKEYLRHRLEDDTQLFSRIGLVIETSEQVGEGGIYAIGEDYRRVIPRDLAVWAINQMIGALAAFAAEHGVYDIGNFGIFYRKAGNSDRIQVVLYIFDPELFHSLPSVNVSYELRTKLSHDPELLYTIDLEVLDGKSVGVDYLDQLIAKGFVAYPTPVGSSSARGLP